MTNPLLIDVPLELRSERLLLRAPRLGDGQIVLPSVRESLPQLKPWMIWATDEYSVCDAESWCRRNAARFITREDFAYLMFLTSGEHVGNVSLFALKWGIPRCEVGYWLRTSHCGRGLMAEAVNRIAAMAFGELGMERVELRCDAENRRSRGVADRCGFALEGILRNESRTPDGSLRDTCIYALLRPAENG